MKLILRSALIAVLSVLSIPSGAVTVTAQDAEGRLHMALQMARERNDKALVADVEKTRRQVTEAYRSGKAEDVDERVRAIEGRVGIDPGGWSMAGQPLFHGTPEMLEKSNALQPKLAAAMKSGDPAQVRAVAAEMLLVLGEQAGVPDGRRAGSKSGPGRRIRMQPETPL